MLYEKIFGQKLEKDLFANSLSGQRAHERKVIVVEFVTVAKIFETAAKNRIEANSIYVHTSIESSPDSRVIITRGNNDRAPCTTLTTTSRHSLLSNRSSHRRDARPTTSRFQLQTRQCFLKVRTEHRETRRNANDVRDFVDDVISIRDYVRWESPRHRLESLETLISHVKDVKTNRNVVSYVNTKSRMAGGQERGEGGKSNEMAVDRKTRW